MKTWKKLFTSFFFFFLVSLEWPSKNTILIQKLSLWAGFSPLTSLFHHRRNPSPIAYFVSSFKAAGRVFDPIRAYLAQSTVHRLLRFTAAIKESPLIKSSWVFLCSERKFR